MNCTDGQVEQTSSFDFISVVRVLERHLALMLLLAGGMPLP